MGNQGSSEAPPNQEDEVSSNDVSPPDYFANLEESYVLSPWQFFESLPMLSEESEIDSLDLCPSATKFRTLSDYEKDEYTCDEKLTNEQIYPRQQIVNTGLWDGIVFPEDANRAWERVKRKELRLRASLKHNPTRDMSEKYRVAKEERQSNRGSRGPSVQYAKSSTDDGASCDGTGASEGTSHILVPREQEGNGSSYGRRFG